MRTSRAYRPSPLYTLLYNNNSVSVATFCKKRHINLQIKIISKEGFSKDDHLHTEMEWIFRIKINKNAVVNNGFSGP